MCEFSRLLIEEGLVQGREEGRAEGKAEGIEEKGVKCFLNCIERGMSIENAKAIAELTDEQVRKAMTMNKRGTQG